MRDALYNDSSSLHFLLSKRVTLESSVAVSMFLGLKNNKSNQKQINKGLIEAHNYQLAIG